MIPTVHDLLTALTGGLALVGAGTLSALGWHLVTGSDVGGWLDHRRRVHRAQHTAQAIAYRRRLTADTIGWLTTAFSPDEPDDPALLGDHPGRPAPLACEDCGHIGQVTAYTDETGTRLVCADAHTCLARQHRRPVSTELVPVR